MSVQKKKNEDTDEMDRDTHTQAGSGEKMFNETWQREGQREGQREVHRGLEDAAAQETTGETPRLSFFCCLKGTFLFMCNAAGTFRRWGGGEGSWRKCDVMADGTWLWPDG